MKAVFVQPITKILMALVVLTLMVAGVAFATLSTPSAHAAQHTSAAQGKHCQVVLDTLHTGEQTSKVLSHQCAQGNQKLAVPQDDTLLMRWWTDANYSGNYTDVYGKFGQCDNTGYGFNYVGDSWNDVISSFQVFNNCIYTRAYQDANFGGYCESYNGDTPYVGDLINDQITSIRTASVYNHC